MRLRLGVLFVGLCLFCGSWVSAQTLPIVSHEGNKIVAGNGYLQDFGSLKLIYLQGSPFEIGLQQGLLITYDQEALAFREAAFQLFNPLAGEHSGLKKIETLFKQFYFDSKLLPTIKRNIPEEYLEEMRGLAVGLTRGEGPIDLESVVMANTYQDLGANYNACTSFAVFNEATIDGSLLHGRNLDSPGMESMAQLGYIAVFNPEQGYPFITHIYPLSCGIMQGMNIAGLSVSMNWSFVQPSEKTLDGMPFTLLLRSLVQYASTIEEALEIIQSVPRTMGLNILISDSKTNRAVVVEATGERYAVRTGDNYVYAANRFLTEYLTPVQREGWLASAFRERRLEELIREHYGNISTSVAVQVLRDKSPQFVPGINQPSSVLTVLFQPTLGRMYVAMIDDTRSAPDQELLAFSLPQVLQGENPLLSDENIAAAVQDSFFQAWTLVQKGELHYRNNQVKEALEALDKLEPEYQDAERVLFVKGHALLRLNQLVEAEKYLLRLVHKPIIAEPYHLLQAWALLGVIYDTWDLRAKAVECYSEALKQSVDDLSGNSNGFYRLAVVGLEKPLRWDHKLSAAIAPGNQEPSGMEDLSVYEGALVRDVRILGAHRTSQALLRQLLRISPGDVLSIKDLGQGERRIKNLKALETVKLVVVPISPDSVDVVLRISEPFGFYFDPVELVVDGLVNLGRQKVALTYYNLGGSLINVGGAVGWGPSRERSVYATFPIGGVAQRLSYSRSRIGVDIVWGVHADQSYRVERETWGGSSTWALGPKTNLALGAQIVTHTVLENELTQGLTTDGQYLDLSVQLLSKTPILQNQGRFNWSGSGAVAVLCSLQDSKELHWRWATYADLLWDLRKGFSVALRGEVKGVSSATPMEYWVALGGNGQLGAASPIFLGKSCLYTKLELRKDINQLWQLAAFWDLGKVGGELGLLTSLGGVIRFQTPVGLTVEGGYSRNLATTHQTWRLGIGASY